MQRYISAAPARQICFLASLESDDGLDFYALLERSHHSAPLPPLLSPGRLNGKGKISPAYDEECWASSAHIPSLSCTAQPGALLARQKLTASVHRA